MRFKDKLCAHHTKRRPNIIIMLTTVQFVFLLQSLHFITSSNVLGTEIYSLKPYYLIKTKNYIQNKPHVLNTYVQRMFTQTGKFYKQPRFS